VLSELNALVRDVDAAMDAFDTHEAGKLLSAFVDDLSNWYVRRSRRRFWQGDPAALATLHEALTTVTLLMAPITPFITEQVWQDMIRPVTPGAPPSVHLASYPVADEALIDPALSTRMTLVRRLVELGRSARADSGMKTRQPLSRAVVSAPGLEDLPADLVAEIAAELNVGTVAPAAGTFVNTAAKANFRTLGKRFGKAVQAVAAAVAAADAVALSEALRATGSASVTVDGAEVTLGPDEVIITETPRPGWAVASEAGATVALDLEITPELRRAGIARDAIRQIQEARKSSGLEVADRIELRYQATDDTTATALAEHSALVADEVLAVDFAEGEPSWSGAFTDETLGLRFWLRKAG
jgi:isoleucyl-tRNA synthetase